MVLPMLMIGMQILVTELVVSGVMLAAIDSPYNTWAPKSTINIKADDGFRHQWARAIGIFTGTDWTTLPSALWAAVAKSRDNLLWWESAIRCILPVAFMVLLVVGMQMSGGISLRDVIARHRHADRGHSVEKEVEREGEEVWPQECRAAYRDGYQRGCRAREREAREGEGTPDPVEEAAPEKAKEAPASYARKSCMEDLGGPDYRRPWG